jgi:hypothetical protein
MKGVTTDMENGFWPKLRSGNFRKVGFSLRGRVEENISFKTFFDTLGEVEGGWRPWVELLHMTLDLGEWFYKTNL